MLFMHSARPARQSHMGALHFFTVDASGMTIPANSRLPDRGRPM
jgi:hypothetical protein